MKAVNIAPPPLTIQRTALAATGRKTSSSLAFSRLRSITLAVTLSAALWGCDISTKNTEPKHTTIQPSETILAQVHKSPNCDCCGKWVEHLDNNGFATSIHDTENLNPIKSKYRIAPRHQSCHTAVIGDYVFEGHIPAPIIQRFLAEKPKDALGLTVPGMPVGSPGMEMNNRQDDYNVLILKNDGSTEIYQRIRHQKPN